MTDLLVGGTVWWAIPTIALTFGAVFGFFPGFVLRLIILLYPADNPRRRELVAELRVLGRIERIEWVFQQLETALFEGISARLKRRKDDPAADPVDETEWHGFPDTAESEAVKQRKFLAHAAAVTVGAHVFGPRAWEPTPTSGRVRMTDVRKLEATIKALRALDHRHGGRRVHDKIAAQLAWSGHLLHASGPAPVLRRLRSAVADLHNLAGWSSFDVGRIDAARNHFGLALELAKAVENEVLVANILYRMGRVYLHKGAPDAALTLFQLGQLAAQESGSALAVAVLCANQAWAYGMMGLESERVTLLRRLRDELRRVDQHEGAAWVTFLNENTW